MVEGNRSPALNTVAELAAPVLHILVELPTMHVCVAALTGAILKCELGIGTGFVRKCRSMASDARCGKVASSERENRLGVLRNTVTCGHKSVYCMTSLTCAFVGTICELPSVLVLVAVLARGMRDWIGQFAGNVALRAVNTDMFADQRKTGLVMIEVCRHTRYRETLRGVAAAAIDSEFTLMNIMVAGFAAREFESLIL